jgi:hypothetical protein
MPNLQKEWDAIDVYHDQEENTLETASFGTSDQTYYFATARLKAVLRHMDIAFNWLLEPHIIQFTAYSVDAALFEAIRAKFLSEDFGLDKPGAATTD